MTHLRPVCSLFLALCALSALAEEAAPAVPASPPAEDKPMFDTRTRRKPVVRPHSSLVRVHTLEDLLKRPEVENKDLPSGIPGGRGGGIGEFLPPDPNIPAPRRADQEQQNNRSGLTKEDLKDARKKDLLTASDLTRDPRKGAGAETRVDQPDLDSLSDHMLFKDVTSLEDQGDVGAVPERGLEARERMLKEEEGEDKAPSLSKKDGPNLPAENLAPGAEVSGAVLGSRAGDDRPAEAAASYSDAILASPSGRSMLREQAEKDRDAATFSRSRELMSAIAAPHLEADRARREAGSQNALQQLTASYRDAAARAQPGDAPALASAPAGQQTPGRSTLLSSTPVGASVGGPSGLGTFSSPLGSAPLGSFTPASTEVRLGAGSALSGPSGASASPSYSLPTAALSPAPRSLAPAAGGSSLMRQRRLDEGRVRSQMDTLPGQAAGGRYNR